MSPLLTSPLVSTQWLADHLGSDDLVVIDATVRTSGIGRGTRWESAHDAYVEDGHVPGAVFADLVDDLSAPGASIPFTRPDVARFERAVSALGVSNGSTVVVYDAAQGEWASRLWWLFRSFGFDTVAVLDGGFGKWSREGRPIRLGALAPRSSTFLATEERPMWADRDRVERAVDGSEPAALVCAADERAFGPAVPELIPGTTAIPIDRVIDEDTNAFLRPRTLSTVFAPVLDAPEVVTYCGVGTAACVDALALTVLGHDHVQVYDGSLADWSRAPEPVAS
ncbi:sulfurtransferase [Curtobacterium sp. MCBD17_019]|uniref:sulfurtransferase n=1 Tax=Curtobacterium sp. MCBD17_019 TaxID=2175669 RepID=UPI000DA9876C|nr:rhodanese-like domain-containing protein [Curtobacterium sp. MCBD17_019]PZE73848.1 sulfurtransferase [Curtobacterium sp. MCBD17_019]